MSEQDSTSPLPILIAGPTASGKSSLAMRLAEACDGVIVNADSMQVYADLRILTARPSAADEARAPHRLYGVLDGAQRCSAGQWARMAALTLKEIAAQGQRAIIVGGTGLYFRVLTDGLSPVPEVGTGPRAEADTLLERLGASGLHDWLASRDPQSAAGIRDSDPQRLLRAASVLLATGEGIAAWQARPGAPIIGEAHRIVLDAERSWLHQRAEERFRAMIAEGAVEEVEALIARGLDPTLPVMKAVGVSPVTLYLYGTLSLDEAIIHAQTSTRQFIKRQSTWFRNQMPRWERLSAQQPEKSLNDLIGLISQGA